MLKQRTLKQAIRTVGIGLHTGKKVTMTLIPASPNTGIIFKRTDLKSPIEVPAHWQYVRDTRLSSTLISQGVRIGTVEHLMAGFAGLGIDNAYVELDAPEVPIMDGSASSFIYLMRSAGIVEQNQPKRFLRIKKEISIVEPNRAVQVLPCEGFKIRFEIDFKHPSIATSEQIYSIDFANESFVNEISRARTFGFMKDVEALRSQGLALGGSKQNAIVLDEHHILNDEGLRYPDEFVRHKTLDAIGDFYLMGSPLLAQINAYKSGHELNNKLVHAIFADETAYEYVTFDVKKDKSSLGLLPSFWQPIASGKQFDQQTLGI